MGPLKFTQVILHYLLFYGKIVLHPLYYTYEIIIKLENLSSLEGTHYECSQSKDPARLYGRGLRGLRKVRPTDLFSLGFGPGYP